MSNRWEYDDPVADPLTQMPDPRLDGITRQDLERELSGNVHIARMHLTRAEQGGDKRAIETARLHLADAYRRARAEHVVPFWHRGGER